MPKLGVGPGLGTPLAGAKLQATPIYTILDCITSISDFSARDYCDFGSVGFPFYRDFRDFSSANSMASETGLPWPVPAYETGNIDGGAHRKLVRNPAGTLLCPDPASVDARKLKLCRYTRAAAKRQSRRMRVSYGSNAN